jgi:hypothetical protein
MTKMKACGFAVALVVLVFAFAPVKVNAGGFAATLISPKAGAVLVPGERVKVEWKTTLPNPINLSWCETELWLSIDGGKTFPMCITPLMDPRVTFFYWTVPNMPTKTAILDVRFGCESIFPESYSPQYASPFEITEPRAQLY